MLVEAQGPARPREQARERPFGFDVVDGRLIPNAREQAAIARMKSFARQNDRFVRSAK